MSTFFSFDQFISSSPQPEETKKYFKAASRWIDFPVDAGGVFAVAIRLNQILEVVHGIDGGLYRHLSSLSKWADHIRELSESHKWKDSLELHHQTSAAHAIEVGQLTERTATIWMMLSVDHSMIVDAERRRFYLHLQVHVLVSIMLAREVGYASDQVALTKMLSARSVGLLLYLPHRDYQGYLAHGDGDITIDTIREWQEWLCRRLRMGNEMFEWCHYTSLIIDTSVEMAGDALPEIYHEEYWVEEREMLWSLSPNGVGDGHSIHLVSDQLGVYDGASVVELREGPDDRLLQDGIYPSEFEQTTESWVSFGGDTKITAQSWFSDVYKAFYRCQAPEKKNYLYDEQSIATSYLRARAAARRRLINKQYLTTRLTRPTAPTIGSILGIMDQLYQMGSSELKETLHLVAVSIVTGVSPTMLIGLPILSTVDEFSLSKHEVAYIPSLNSFFRKGETAGNKNLVEIFQIGDFLRLGRLFDLSHSNVFRKSKGEYLSVYQAVVMKAFIKAGVDKTWVRFYRIPHLFLKYFVGIEEANRLKVLTLFGVPSVGDMGGVYTAFHLQDLNHFYSCELRDLYDRLARNGYRVNDQGMFRWDEMGEVLRCVSRGSVGSRRLPDVGKTAQVVDLLQGKLSGKVGESGSALNEYHNDLTTYVALVLSLVTAFRAVRTPILNLLLIDPDAGMMPLQEKDRKDHAHARVVFVPKNVRSLISYYLNHLRRFIYTFDCGCSGASEVSATKYRDRVVAKQFNFNDSVYQLILNRNLFFVDRRGGKRIFSEVTGHSLMIEINRIVTGAWSADNSNRHWVRSYLQENGCSDTVTYAFMGHWANDGEEYWAEASAMDPLLYRDHIAPHIERLLDRVRFDPQKVIESD